jgi:hypothetical protein
MEDLDGKTDNKKQKSCNIKISSEGNRKPPSILKENQNNHFTIRELLEQKANPSNDNAEIDSDTYTKKFDTNMQLPPYLKEQDIVFKGENGNHEVFEIKFRKINNNLETNTEEQDLNKFMSERLERNNNYYLENIGVQQ